MTDDELKIELRKSTEPSKNVEERWERLKTKANALEWEDKVDVAKSRKGTPKVINIDVAESRGNTSESNSYQRAKEWMNWASERGLNTRIKEKEDHRGRLQMRQQNA
ncbi:hypothetical protein EGH25_10595 [Haladaptatus sp. F3-133]|uniref:Uncharacterized protein n=1 Tax=Halorutilus salinus TaxID=2487751 RepID=A0A9Q4C651_9EURY|nr:hypothetical protein [Halorutilus salinus]MCX2819797.1 hypothetical protein [Halorutilus salinus]